MVDLTVVILTKNEEQNLRKCIESFQGIAKRFVVVDSFSTDNTEKLCIELDKELQQSGGKLDFYQNEWSNHAGQFNWGIENTDINTEWSMRMDADEELTEELVDEIASKLPTLKSDINGVVLRRRVYFMGRWIKHGGRYPEKLLRIFRTGKALCEQKIMDEHLILLEGNITEFNYDFMDKNTKHLEWWTNKHNWYSNLEVLDYQMTVQSNSQKLKKTEKGESVKQAKRKRLVKNIGYYRFPKFFRAHIYFIYRYYIKLGFLDGPEGKIFHFLQAYWYRFLVDAKMYECEKFNKKMNKQDDLKA
ncbi:glycosyltransferase family 2 protein [Priestia megaterium]|uniref:glycosyltransferase family 2 protein n=1 Tax=Priestia megaterium TaxID=1404 RepID=UPI0030F3D294